MDKSLSGPLGEFMAAMRVPDVWPKLREAATWAACWCGVTTEKVGIGTGDVDIFEQPGTCGGDSCFVPESASGIPLLSDDLLDAVGVVVKGVACDDTDEVLIAAMTFGGRGTGDCLEGTGAGILAGLCAPDTAFASPSTACLSGGGGF